MSEAAAALVLSVGMHITWNLIARRQPQAAQPLWWVLLAHLLLIGPWGLWALAKEAQWSPSFLALLLTSAAANACYFVGLARAYRHAPVSLVYPLVRSSPLLIALWSSILLGVSLATNTWLGILLSVGGLALMASSGLGVSDRRALPWALLAMVSTSVYSLSDKAATAHLPSFLALVGYISVGYAAAWVGLTVVHFRATGRWLPQARISRSALLVGGLCIGLAYALVIHAMRTLSAAEAVAYSNAGIVAATLIGITVFHERTHWRRRLLAAVLIVAGLAWMG
jgi:phosphonate utilization associated putative membrane protein